MTEVTRSRDCGNSPKNKFVQEVAVALETGEATTLDFSEDVVWEGVSDEPIHGIGALIQVLADRTAPVAVTVEHSISHGKVGSASGQTTLGNGRSRRFSHIFEFTNTKANRVAVIKTYA
ncbi:hypothetical protein [Chelativorans sp. AA-79]|uniref:hypothetical protein n=1 Tax=Chelativorans sp. AA-79 TaxID=3028735 RepID=UPI0023F95308|nr:hypothetical protein [Chelativorans sp. AA-79]WEX07510.1 hypothetical protein PVE73_15450 [Chelativorans sp. AA-79]